MSEYILPTGSGGGFETHKHPASDVTSLTAWQASVERSLASHDRAIALLKKAMFSLILMVFALCILMLVLYG